MERQNEKRGKKIIFLRGLLLGIILCVSCFGAEMIWASEGELRFEHTYPKTMKVGEVFPEEYYVNIYGFEPNEVYDEGLPNYENAYTTNGEFGGWGGQADENGNVLKLSNTDWMTYKPGPVIVKLYLGRELDSYVEYEIEVATIMVEEPVITHNAPFKVKVGEVIDFSTAITNTAYENKKVSEYESTAWITFYVPSVEVIDGKNLVKQSEQDYTNTLNTSEKLSFTGSGTVKLKISYSPMAYDWVGGEEDFARMPLDGVMEKIVTIVVEDDKPVATTPNSTTGNKPTASPTPKSVTTQAPTPKVDKSETETVPTEKDKAVATIPDSTKGNKPTASPTPKSVTTQTPTSESVTTQTPTSESVTTQAPTPEVDKPEKETVPTEDTAKENAYVVQIKDGKKFVTKDEFANILKENKDRDVVIQSNDDIAFTFKKGSMSEVDDMESYDFGSEIEKGYIAKLEQGTKVNESNFVTKIHYNYEGNLPGVASIKINVGVEQKGVTLYYSKLCDDGKILYICSATVDDEGYITVHQESCSDYILTTERVDSTTEENNISNTQTEKKNYGGPNILIIVIIVIIVIVVVAGIIAWLIFRKQKNN